MTRRQKKRLTFGQRYGRGSGRLSGSLANTPSLQRPTYGSFSPHMPSDLSERERRVVDTLLAAAEDKLLDLVQNVTGDAPHRRMSLPTAVDVERGNEVYSQSHFEPRWSHGLIPAIAPASKDRETLDPGTSEFGYDASYITRTVESRIFELPHDKSFVVETKVTHGEDYWSSDNERLQMHTIWVCDRQAKDVSNYTKKSRQAIKRSLLFSNF